MECILVLQNLSLYESTRKYYKTYTGTSYLILVLRSISWSYETYTCITELILVFRILHGAYSDIKVPVGTTEILRNVYWYCGTYPYTEVPVNTTKLILVFRILYLYYEVYSYDTELILGLQIREYP